MKEIIIHYLVPSFLKRIVICLRNLMDSPPHYQNLSISLRLQNSKVSEGYKKKAKATLANERGFTVCDTPAGGNCLFSAICIQLRNVGIQIALKCKTLGGILRCRLWMQTNALSRHKMQVALLAEPKTPLESSVFILLALRSCVRNYCSFPDEH